MFLQNTRFFCFFLKKKHRKRDCGGYRFIPSPKYGKLLCFFWSQLRLSSTPHNKKKEEKRVFFEKKNKTGANPAWVVRFCTKNRKLYFSKLQNPPSQDTVRSKKREMLCFLKSMHYSKCSSFGNFDFRNPFMIQWKLLFF